MVGERPQRAVEKKETYSIYLWRFAKKGIVPVPVPLNKTFACERDFWRSSKYSDSKQWAENMFYFRTFDKFIVLEF